MKKSIWWELRPRNWTLSDSLQTLIYQKHETRPRQEFKDLTLDLHSTSDTVWLFHAAGSHSYRSWCMMTKGSSRIVHTHNQSREWRQEGRPGGRPGPGSSSRCPWAGADSGAVDLWTKMIVSTGRLRTQMMICSSHLLSRENKRRERAGEVGVGCLGAGEENDAWQNED